MLVIIGMAAFWYGLAPLAGALYKRYKWHIFRKRFDELRLSPILDYQQYSRQGKNGDKGQTPPDRKTEAAATFRFTGGFESITDGQTMWIRGENLTVPVSLQDAETFLLPMQKGEHIAGIFDPVDEAPERIRWERVSSLTAGAKVFVGGLLTYRDGRWSFVSSKERPLMVIFYDGPDHSLTTQAIRAGRHQGEYWNAITPYALIAGAVSQILIAAAFLPRPAFRLTVVVAIIALFVPLYPVLPPGLLFTVMYRRLAWRSRILRAYRDLARLPLCYLKIPMNQSCLLPNGEQYGYVRCDHLPARAGTVPLLLPEFTQAKGGGPWFIFGALRPNGELPARPEDSFATFGMLPGKPEELARHYEIKAYILEFAAWVLLLAGIGLNIFFLRMVLVLL